MSTWNLESSKHGWRIRNSGDIGANGGHWSSADDTNVSLLEAIVGASNAKQQQSQEDDCTNDQKNFKLSERLQGCYRSLGEPKIDESFIKISIY